MALYLSIDLGTTGCRSILFDGGLHPLADSYREYALETPGEGRVEQDAGLWWELTLQTAKEALRQAGPRRGEVRALSVSSQGITLVPVDRDFHPLRPALSWLDTRAQEQAQQLAREVGEDRLFRLTGKPASAVYFLPKLLWLRAHEPELFDRARKFVMPMDFLLGKLTGNCVTDHSMASGTLMYDIRAQRWSRSILQKYGIPEEKLPRIMWSGERAGTLLPGVAQELQLSPDCVVGVGAQDQKCAFLGVGLEEGMAAVSLGTACAVGKGWPAARTEKEAVPWSAYVREGTWITEGVIDTAGGALRWLRDLLFPGASYDAINREAQLARERGSSLLCFPFLDAAPAHPQGCFYGVKLSTTRGDFALAVLEGVAFEIRKLLGEMEVPPDDRLVLFGGGSRSPLWCQIIADVTGRAVSVPATSEAAGAGAALLAGLAAGDFSRDRLPRVESARTVLPGPCADSCAEKYRRYCEIAERLRDEGRG